MESRQQVFPRVLRKIINFRGGRRKVHYLLTKIFEGVVNKFLKISEGVCHNGIT